MVHGAGQERSIIPTAQHTACTIEMTNLLKRVDVAVIDEIQVSLAALKHSPHYLLLTTWLLMTESWQVLLCWSNVYPCLIVVVLRGSGECAANRG